MYISQILATLESQGVYEIELGGKRNDRTRNH